MKIATGIVAVAAALSFVLTGCSSEDQQNAQDTAQNAADSLGDAAQGALDSAESAAPGLQSTAADALDSAGNTFDDAKRATFVAAYRAQFETLAEGRSDEDIEALLGSTCQQIADGRDEAEIKTEIESLATNNGNAPSADEANRIFDQAELACP